jgi:hypothetical protein
MDKVRSDLVELDHGRARKLADQRGGSKAFWENARWTKEEKRYIK